MSRVREAIGLVGAVIVLGGCVSPESRRTRGGGPGADIKNRDAVVQMHAGSKMYYETPCLLPEESCTGPAPTSGLPGDFPEPRRQADNRK